MWTRVIPLCTASLIGGLALAHTFAIGFWPWLLLATVLLSVFVIMVPIKVRENRSVLWAVCTLAVSLMSGICYYEWTDARNQTQIIPVGQADEYGVYEPVRIMGMIDSPIEIDGDRLAFQLSTRVVETQEVIELVAVSVRLLSEQEQRTAMMWERGEYIAVSGQLVRPDGARNEGGFDYRRYLRLQQIHWQLRAKGLTEVQVRESSWNTHHLLRYLDRSRTYLSKQIDALYEHPANGFMNGILLGLRDSMDPQQYRQFSLLGLTHIIAISGLNVAIFVFLCFLLLKPLRRTRETEWLIVMWLIPLYILITGASPSVVRAGLMAMIVLWALRLRLLKNGVTILSLVAAAMLLANPYYLVDIGFQLSFLVTLGLLLGVPLFNRIFPLKYTWLRNAVSVTTVAQLIAFPLTIFYFNQFSLLSWMANLVLVPYVSLLIYPLGLATLLVALVSDTLAGWLAMPVHWLNAGLFRAVEYFSGFREMLLIFPTPSLGWVFVYYLVCGAMAWCLLRYRERLNPDVPQEQADWLAVAVPAYRRSQAPRYLIGALAGVLALSLLLLSAYYPPHMQAQGTVSFLDVGQGDATLLETPDRRHILIDGGGTIRFGEQAAWAKRRDPFEIGEKVLVPLLKKRGVQQLDWLIISHQDADHIGGLEAVLKSILVRRLLFNGTLKPSEQAARLFELALAKGVQLYEAKAGEQLQVDRHTALHVLAPSAEQIPTDEDMESVAEQNEHSLVFVMRMLDKQLLFTGDMDDVMERRILREQRSHGQLPASFAGPIDLLKVAHHGSKSSSSAEWLSFWNARNAVISAGRNNRYGHPHPDVLRRLSAVGSEIFRTDRQGEIRAHVTAEKISILPLIK